MFGRSCNFGINDGSFYSVGRDASSAYFAMHYDLRHENTQYHNEWSISPEREKKLLQIEDVTFCENANKLPVRSSFIIFSCLHDSYHDITEKIHFLQLQLIVLFWFLATAQVPGTHNYDESLIRELPRIHTDCGLLETTLSSRDGLDSFSPRWAAYVAAHLNSVARQPRQRSASLVLPSSYMLCMYVRTWTSRCCWMFCRHNLLMIFMFSSLPVIHTGTKTYLRYIIWIESEQRVRSKSDVPPILYYCGIAGTPQNLDEGRVSQVGVEYNLLFRLRSPFSWFRVRVVPEIARTKSAGMSTFPFSYPRF